jgi:hypothetical protein
VSPAKYPKPQNHRHVSKIPGFPSISDPLHHICVRRDGTLIDPNSVISRAETKIEAPESLRGPEIGFKMVENAWPCLSFLGFFPPADGSRHTVPRFGWKCDEIGSLGRGGVCWAWVGQPDGYCAPCKPPTRGCRAVSLPKSTKHRAIPKDFRPLKTPCPKP